VDPPRGPGTRAGRGLSQCCQADEGRFRQDPGRASDGTTSRKLAEEGPRGRPGGRRDAAAAGAPPAGSVRLGVRGVTTVTVAQRRGVARRGPGGVLGHLLLVVQKALTELAAAAAAAALDC
jgi:hypothetical protein